MSESSQDPSTQDIDQISLLRSLHGLVHGADGESTKKIIQTLRDHFSGHPEDVWALALRIKLQPLLHDFSDLEEAVQRAIRLGHAWAAEPAAVWALGAMRSAPGNFDLAMPILARYVEATNQPPRPNDLLELAWSELEHKDVTYGRVLHLLRLASLQPQHLQNLDATVAAASKLMVDVNSLHRDLLEELAELNGDAKGAAEQLHAQVENTGLLVRQVTAGAVESGFTESAQKSKTQSARLFAGGIAALGAAIVVAGIPLLRDGLNEGQILAAHASATLAIGALAGVLLGRSRNRDRAGQRQSDLAIAMGEVAVYAGNITNLDERQKWMQTMGQAVLIAHLQPDTGGGSGEGQTVLATLLAQYTKKD